MSAKCLDRKGRWRKVTVAFRASPEENEQIAAFAKLCGMTKQDYMLSRSLQKEVIVQGNLQSTESGTAGSKRKTAAGDKK